MSDRQEKKENPVDKQTEILNQLVKTNQLLSELANMFGSLNLTIASTLKNIANDTELMKLSLRKLVKIGPTEITMGPTGPSPSTSTQVNNDIASDRQAFPE